MRALKDVTAYEIADAVADSNCWMDPDRVQPGRINTWSINLFTSGQCHALAMALHNRTGWTLVGAGWSLPRHPNHLLVKTPDGRFLDITGAHDQNSVESTWCKIEFTTMADIDRHVSEGNLYRPHLNVAELFASRVLDRYVPDLVS